MAVVLPIVVYQPLQKKPRRKLISVSKENGVLLFNCHKTAGKKTLFNLTRAVNSRATKCIRGEKLYAIRALTCHRGTPCHTGQIVDERASITQIAETPFDSRLRRNVAVIKPTEPAGAVTQSYFTLKA